MLLDKEKEDVPKYDKIFENHFWDISKKRAKIPVFSARLQLYIFFLL